MEKINSFFKDNWQLIVVFFLSLLIYTIFGFYINSGDPIASYGFSHAIKMGQIPYLDFNTISTPLYAFYNALLLVVCDEFIFFLVGQAILVTIMFYFLFKLYGNKSWFVFLSMIIFKFFGFTATYNLCCLVVSVIVLYLETKYPKKDFLIGVFLALAFLSKQTIGALLVIPSIFICFKDIKRLMKRIGGFLVPILIFFFYLLVTNSLYEFVDLCLLGLFDFAGSNGKLFTIWFFVSIVLLCINVLLMIKDKKVTDYYGLAYFGFMIPLFNLSHFAYYLTGFTIILLFHVKNKLTKYKVILVGTLIIQFLLFNFFMGIREYDIMVYNDVNHFNGVLGYTINYETEKEHDKLIEKYSSKDYILMMSYSMKYNIIHNRNINYFDVFLYGNYGYNGLDKLNEKIDKMHNVYFIINMNDYKNAEKNGSQFNDKTAEYVISVCEFVESNGNLNVYYKE